MPHAGNYNYHFFAGDILKKRRKLRDVINDAHQSIYNYSMSREVDLAYRSGSFTEEKDDEVFGTEFYSESSDRCHVYCLERSIDCQPKKCFFLCLKDEKWKFLLIFRFEDRIRLHLR